MSYVILCPYTHRGYYERCIASMSLEVLGAVMAVDNSGAQNLGAAASYNVGARRVLEDGLDWLITLSPSTRFGPTGGVDFVESLHGCHADAWVVEASMPVGWHFIAWHRRVFERVGLWDENFWPVYGEDADISHRILTAMREDDATDVWRHQPIDAWLAMQGYSARVAGIAEDQTAIWDYYVRKWGGRSGHEQWERPFNCEPLDYWRTS